MLTPELFIVIAISAVAMAAIRLKSRPTRTTAVFALVVIAICPSAAIDQNKIRLSSKESAKLHRSANSGIVVALEKAHGSGEISDAEYAWRLHERALNPAKRILEDLRSQARLSDGQKWIFDEISDWEFRCIGLQIVIDIYSSRAELRVAKAQALDDDASATIALDSFWKDRFPVLKANREKLLEYMHKPSNFTDDDRASAVRALLRGLDSDLQILADHAAHLEIRRTEAWLNRLKNELSQKTNQDKDRKTERLPTAETPPRIALDVGSHLERLEIARESMDAPPARLQALEKHLERIQEAIPRTAAFSGDIHRDVHQ